MRLARKNSGPISIDQPFSVPIKTVARVARSCDEEVNSPARSLQSLLEVQVARDPVSGPSSRDFKRAGVLAFGLLAASVFCLAFWMVVLDPVKDLLRAA